MSILLTGPALCNGILPRFPRLKWVSEELLAIIGLVLLLTAMLLMLSALGSTDRRDY